MWKLRYLAPAGLLALLLARRYDDFTLAFVLMAWTGVALALRLRPALAGLVADRRPPTGADAGAVLVGLVTAYLAFGAVDQLLLLAANSRLYGTGALSALMSIPALLAGGWLLLAIAPAAIQMARPGAASTAVAARGLAASVPLGLALLLLWQVAGKDAVEGDIDASLVLRGLTLIPITGLLASFGGILWWPTVATPGERAPVEPFGIAVRGATIAWAAASAGAVLALGGSFIGSDRVNSGAVLALGWTAVIGAVWVGALVRLDTAPARRTWRASLAVALLFVAFLVSLAPAFTLLEAGHSPKGDAGLLAAILLLPVFAVVVAACLGLAPWLVRRVAGDRHPR